MRLDVSGTYSTEDVLLNKQGKPRHGANEEA